MLQTEHTIQTSFLYVCVCVCVWKKLAVMLSSYVLKDKTHTQYGNLVNFHL
jgi:hypothetical protein